MLQKIESLQIKASSQYKESQWSGGSTTEMLIHPETATYAARDFEWRISSAKIEQEQAGFTPLPGYRRLLMVLEGVLELQHVGQYEKMLYPLEFDAFSGDWESVSKGRVIDFNVMFNPNWEAKIAPVFIQPDESQQLLLKGERQILFVFKGQIRVNKHNLEKASLCSALENILVYSASGAVLIKVDLIRKS